MPVFAFLAKAIAPIVGAIVRLLGYWATELKLDAERKGGRILTEMERAKPGDNQWSSQAASTLKKLGVTYSLSSRWQLSGTVSDENYRTWLVAQRRGDRGARAAQADRQRDSGELISSQCIRVGKLTDIVAGCEMLAPSG